MPWPEITTGVLCLVVGFLLGVGANESLRLREENEYMREEMERSRQGVNHES